jgi:hypothetical protein
VWISEKCCPYRLVKVCGRTYPLGLRGGGLTANRVKSDVNRLVFLGNNLLRGGSRDGSAHSAFHCVLRGYPSEAIQTRRPRRSRGRGRRGFRRTGATAQTVAIGAAIPSRFGPFRATTPATIPAWAAMGKAGAGGHAGVRSFVGTTTLGRTGERMRKAGPAQ